MAKIDRLERLDQRRADMESEYRAILIAALERTAAGKPGLFNHRADKRERAAVAPVIDELRELGDAIDGHRETVADRAVRASPRLLRRARPGRRQARSASPSRPSSGSSGWPPNRGRARRTNLARTRRGRFARILSELRVILSGRAVMLGLIGSES